MNEFLDDIISVYIKHGMSISHQDYQGCFIVEAISDYNINWLLDATDGTNEDT